MKCQSCNENEATVHLTQVVGGNIRKMHYCEACARKEGVARVLFAGKAGWQRVIPNSEFVGIVGGQHIFERRTLQ